MSGCIPDGAIPLAHELTPAQYHGVLDRLWEAVGPELGEHDDVFDKVICRIAELEADVERLHGWKNPTIDLIRSGDMTQYECKIVDVGHSEIALVIECPELAALPTEVEVCAAIRETCTHRTQSGAVCDHCLGILNRVGAAFAAKRKGTTA